MKKLNQTLIIISIIILSTACSQKENTQPVLFKHHPRENIRENYGNDIVVDLKNNKWITTYAGLLKYDNQKWTVYNIASGAPSDTLLNIAIDSKDNIYCLTLSQKIVCFDGNTWRTIQNPQMIYPTTFCVDRNDNCISACLDSYERLVTGLCLSCRYFVVDVYNSWEYCHFNCIDNN